MSNASNAEIYYEGRKALDEFVHVSGNEISINRTAMVTKESRSILLLSIKCDKKCSGKFLFKPAMIY